MKRSLPALHRCGLRQCLPVPCYKALLFTSFAKKNENLHHYPVQGLKGRWQLLSSPPEQTAVETFFLTSNHLVFKKGLFGSDPFALFFCSANPKASYKHTPASQCYVLAIRSCLCSLFLHCVQFCNYPPPALFHPWGCQFTSPKTQGIGQWQHRVF